MSWFEDKLPAISLAHFQAQKYVEMFTDSACREPAQLEFQLSWQSAPTESQSGKRAAPNSQPVPWFVSFMCAPVWRCYVGTAEQAGLRGKPKMEEAGTTKTWMCSWRERPGCAWMAPSGVS